MRTPSGKTKMQRRRVELSMTIAELAEATGIDARMLQKYEGRATKPDGTVVSPIEGISIDRLVSIAKALKCKVSDLIEDDTIRDSIRAYEKSLCSNAVIDVNNPVDREKFVADLERYASFLASRPNPPNEIVESANNVIAYEKALKQMEWLKTNDLGMFREVVKSIEQ